MILSIIIVSYNVREFLEQALLSIDRAVGLLDHEIFVVDNNSMDGSAEFVRQRFPAVRLIALNENLGFARANNLAMALASGRFLCLINPDTIVQEDTFTTLLAFFDKHPEAGLLGCKILNPDGTLQLACRRSFPTPWVAFSKIIGLAALFPRSRLFGRYNLTFLDENEVSEVEAISGSFMLVRRDAVEQVGMLDESFFMYGEDLDWCFRIRSAGWKVCYVPTTQIIHFKGESSKRSPFEQRRLFYEAMRLFVRKHFQRKRAWIPSWTLIAAIRLRALAALISALLRTVAWPLLDLAMMTAALAIAIHLRFAPRFPWESFLIVHALYSAVWLAALALHGLYHSWRFSIARSGAAVLAGLVINSAITFFLKEIGFSRLVVLYAGGLNLLLLPGWRLLLKLIAQRPHGLLARRAGRLLLHRSALLVGDRSSCDALLERLRRRTDATYQIRGIVLPAAAGEHPAPAGVPVYAGLEHLPALMTREKVDEVIFATDQLPYQQLLAVISSANGHQVTFKLVPSSMEVIIGKASVEYIDDVPLMEIEYKLQERGSRILKRLLDLFLASLLLLLTWPVWIWARLVKRFERRRVLYSGPRGSTFVIREWQLPGGARPWWSLLPRIAAIWRGRMSFVGAPLQLHTPEREPIWPLLPGLTSLEEVEHPGAIAPEERDRSRLFYAKNYSPGLDLEIMLKSLFKSGNHKDYAQHRA